MIKSLKQLLKDVENASLKNFIKKQKRIIEDELGYSRRERVDEDFLFTVLSEGFINEEYRYYIQQTSEDLLDANARFYLKTVKNELEPEFTKKITDVESVVAEIKDFQWSSPSVLNNDVFTYLNKYKLSNQIDWFINAIKNYYEEYGKKYFIDQYVASIEKRNDEKEIINCFLGELSKKLNSDISKEVKLDVLLSFFSDDSGSLFCEMIKNRFADDAFTRVLNDFFEKRKLVFDYTLDCAEQNVSLKQKLIKMNIEVEKIADYADSTQKKLIDNAMFRISKENLDYILACQSDIQPSFYYDYIRKNNKLKNKVNDYVDEILLNDDRIYFSKEGIVDFLFTANINYDIAKLTVEKLEDYFVELKYLPKVYKGRLDGLMSDNINIVHLLAYRNKIKIDLNNVLYLSWSGLDEDMIKLAEQQILLDRASDFLIDIDEYAKMGLNSFYRILLLNIDVDVSLFKEESKLLIKNNIDIVELVAFFINEWPKIPINKMHKLIELTFTRPVLNNNSNKTFAVLIKKSFDYFCDYLGKNYEKKSHSWILNLSVLLKNEYNVLEEKHLNSIMNVIEWDVFARIVREWNEEIGIYNSAEIVKRLLSEKNMDARLMRFGETEALKFINSNKNYLDYSLEELLIRRVERKRAREKNAHIDEIIGIARFYGLQQNAIVNYNSYPCIFKEVINELQKDYEPNWDKINESVVSMFKKGNFDPINNLFVLGRYFYGAIERGTVRIKDYLSKEKNILLYYSKHSSFDSFLCGTVFGLYFDYEGNLISKSVKNESIELVDYFNSFANIDARRFIEKCVTLSKG